MRTTRSWYRLLLLVLFFASAKVSSAQSGMPTPETVYKNWTMLAESSKLLDISYRIIKCGSTAQVHLLIFNENVMDQEAKFTLEISDAANVKSFTKAFNFSTKKLTMYKALCNSEAALDVLKFDLPEGYDPASISLKLTFQP